MKKITLLFALVFSSSLMFGQIYFEDDFDGSGPGIAGWTLNNVDGLTPNVNVAEFTDAWIEVDLDGSATGGGNYGGPAGEFAVASTSWYTPAGTSDDWIITPQINLPADATLYWDAKAQDATYADGYEVRVSTTGNNPADFTDVLLTVPNAMVDWESLQLDLSAYTGQNIYVAFRNNSTDQFVLLVDNVEVSATPACLAPSDFSIGLLLGITTTSAEIAWLDGNGPGTLFDIEWGPAGFTLGSGTVVNGIGDLSYNFDGLMPNTAYDFYITANCTGGLGDSEQVGPIGFLTNFDCSTYGVPYNENFDNPTAFDSCFTLEDVDGDTLAWISQQDLDLDGDGTNETFATNASGDPADVTNGGNKDDWLFSPALALNGGEPYQLSTAYNVLQGTANASLEAFILDGPSATANVVATLFSNAGFTTQGDFATLETMAYQEMDMFTPATSGDYYIGYRSFGPRGGGFLLMFNSSLISTLSVDEFQSNNFNYTYNKNTDLLTIESSNLPFDSIEMFSILGQKVISRKLSAQNEAIDMSSLTDGVYLATVNINGSSKTIKILKQ
ncbi:choice-of-anchor J domain-containing protein [Psychroserpens sp.]|uniref:choice-of-anchor J domain-containing protein n=1 Tax=Psychroserpens sp. TaxID=2020870 RepID=UPI00385AAD5A